MATLGRWYFSIIFVADDIYIPFIYTKPPTGHVDITFEDWLEVAVKGQTVNNISEREHVYFRVNCFPEKKENMWIMNDIPIYKPSN